MDMKLYFQDLVKNKKYSFSEFLTIYREIKEVDRIELTKYLFGPGRDFNYIPRLNENEVSLFMNILLTNKENPSLELIKEKLNKQIELLASYIKSHTGRLINPSSTMSLLKVNKNDIESKFFTSDNAQQRKFSYAGNAVYQKDRLFLEGFFYLNDKLTSFIEIIVNSDIAIKNFSHYEEMKELFNALKQELNNYKSCNVNDELPQTFYPTKMNQYVALTILPAFNMLNQIKVSINNLYINNKDDENLNHYVKKQMLKIGGAQPQNVASFNSDNAGVYQMLDNTPPFIINNKQIINEKVFFKNSLISYYTEKIVLNKNFNKFNHQKKIKYIEIIVEDFLNDKLKEIIHIISNKEQYLLLLEKSEINEMEKLYVETQSKNSNNFDYFYEKLSNQLYAAVANEDNSDELYVAFKMESKQILKQLLGEIL